MIEWWSVSEEHCASVQDCQNTSSTIWRNLLTASLSVEAIIVWGKQSLVKQASHDLLEHQKSVVVVALILNFRDEIIARAQSSSLQSIKSSQKVPLSAAAAAAAALNELS